MQYKVIFGKNINPETFAYFRKKGYHFYILEYRVVFEKKIILNYVCTFKWVDFCAD